MGDSVRIAAAEVEETRAAAIADEPDGVHQHRVRVRRLRSVLAGFRDSLDAHAADALRAQFKEWGSELGVARDIEVRAAVAEDALAQAGVDDDVILQRLVGSEREAYARAHARLVELSETPRSLERFLRLRRFAAASVVREPDRDAASFVAAVLREQARRVRRAVRRLDDSPESYHAVRKAARRLRYVAEAIGRSAPGLFPEQVADLAAAGDALHDALGKHRDGLLFAEHVEREAARAAHATEPTTDYEVIAANARRDAEEHLRALPAAVARLKAAAASLE